jgi:hypothetical protein
MAIACMSNSGCDGMGWDGICYVINGEWGEVQTEAWFKNIPMSLRIASMTTTATAGVEHP